MPEGTSLMDFLLVWGLRIGAALVVFLIGRLVVNWIVRFARRYMERRKLDALIVNFTANILNWALLLIVIIMSLNQLGIDTTAMVALLAAAGLAIGLALQDSMKNFASGVLLIVFRPFATGHYVEAAGSSGIVESITLFTSTLLTLDNREIIVPNSSIYADTITNYSSRPLRRVDMVFGVSYGDDLRKVRELLQQIVAEDKRVLADPAPTIVVGELADSSVNFFVQPWVKNADYWDVKWAITERVKLTFDDQGITIPYPQMDVHMQNSGA
ncbi:MAG: mechanosensitive ion channel [Caldilineaceae bacterium]|nr:mechanosensitive ion channel [Caldilineaceae bacterium]